MASTSLRLLAEHSRMSQLVSVLTRFTSKKAMRNYVKFSSLGVMSSADDGTHGNENALQEAVKQTKFQLPQHHPTKFDRITLIATGTMKAHEIGDEVSFPAIAKANSRRRIIVNILLMVFGLCGYIYMMQRTKKAMETESLYKNDKDAK